MKQLIFLLLFTSAIFAQSELPLLFDDEGYKAGTYRLLMPDTIYATTTDTVKIFYDNLGLNLPSSLNITVTPNIGSINSDHWAWKPVDRDTFTLSMIYNNKDTITTTMLVSDSLVILTPKTMLAIGDSRTTGRDWIARLRTFAGDSLTMIGTQGSSGNLHEAYGGKTYQWMVSDTASPFCYGGYVNFAQYLTDNSYSAPDYVAIRLGTNDVFSATNANLVSRVSTALNYVDSLINSIHSAGANTQIGLCLETPPAYKELFLSTYPSGSYEQYKENIHYFNEQMLAKYGDGGTRELDYVKLIPLYPSSDKNNDFVNGVHETENGYYLNAIPIFGWLKSYDNYPQILSDYTFADASWWTAEVAANWTLNGTTAVSNGSAGYLRRTAGWDAEWVNSNIYKITMKVTVNSGGVNPPNDGSLSGDYTWNYTTANATGTWIMLYSPTAADDDIYIYSNSFNGTIHSLIIEDYKAK